MDRDRNVTVVFISPLNVCVVWVRIDQMEHFRCTLIDISLVFVTDTSQAVREISLPGDENGEKIGPAEDWAEMGRFEAFAEAAHVIRFKQ